MKTKSAPDKIAAIAAEMASITEFAQGSLSCSSNWVTHKDGTRHKASPHYKFQSLGGRGKRTYRNVPADAVARVRKLVDNYRRYARLEKEYLRLVTAQSLSSLKKSAES